MATIDQVLDAVQAAVYKLLVTQYGTNPPAQIIIGWPYAPALSEILGEGEAQISIFPLAKSAQNRTSRHPRWYTVTQNPVTLIATITTVGGNLVITYTGTPQAGFNIHTFLDNPVYDAYYQTTAEDSLDTVAAAVADKITALDAPGVSASATGAAVTVSGTTKLKCNIGGTATMAQEVRRTMTPVQVSVWAPNAESRRAIGQMIENGLALDFPIPFLQAADGAAIFIRMRGAPMWNDDSQRAYSLYQWHGVFECEYPTHQISTGTQVESVGAKLNQDARLYTGGP
jgi:hypothetical protein